MKLKLFILFLLHYTFSYSQSTDSLLFQINSIANDTESVNQLYKHGFELRNSDPTIAWIFGQACEKRALESNSPKHLAKAYNLLGILNYKKTEYLKAIKFQKKALALNEKVNYEKGCAINLSNLGNIYSDIKYYQLAENAYLKALKLNNKLGNTKEITRCLINIAALKHEQKENEIAVINLKQALIYATELNDYELIATCNNNIGIALVEQNKLDTALFYLQDALKMRKIIGDESDLINSYISIADVYIKQKNINDARNFLSLAENSSFVYQKEDELIHLYLTKSEFYEKQDNFQEANLWLKKYVNLKDSLLTLENEDIIVLDEPVISEVEESFYSKYKLYIFTVLSLLIGCIFGFIIFRKK